MTSPFRLILEDDRQAAWMAINDTFKKAIGRDDPQKASHGFLLQLGKARRWPEKAEMNEVGALVVKDEKGVEMHRIDGGVLADPSKICWVNIYRQASPMSFGELLNLRAIEPDRRPLHKFHVPYQGGITIWPNGSLRILMDAARASHHVRYTFELDSPVAIEIHDQDGLRFSTTTASSVVVEAIPEGGTKPPPGETENPPQYP